MGIFVAVGYPPLLMRRPCDAHAAARRMARPIRPVAPMITARIMSCGAPEKRRFTPSKNPFSRGACRSERSRLSDLLELAHELTLLSCRA